MYCHLFLFCSECFVSNSFREGDPVYRIPLTTSAHHPLRRHSKLHRRWRKQPETRLSRGRSLQFQPDLVFGVKHPGESSDFRGPQMMKAQQNIELTKSGKSKSTISQDVHKWMHGLLNRTKGLSIIIKTSSAGDAPRLQQRKACSSRVNPFIQKKM